jgi:hypothetical protein
MSPSVPSLSCPSRSQRLLPTSRTSLEELTSRVTSSVPSSPSSAVSSFSESDFFVLGTSLSSHLVLRSSSELPLLFDRWIVEFISAPAVAGFMTGSGAPSFPFSSVSLALNLPPLAAISICAGQVPGLMGYSSKFNTKAETYKVIINS